MDEECLLTIRCTRQIVLDDSAGNMIDVPEYDFEFVPTFRELLIF